METPSAESDSASADSTKPTEQLRRPDSATAPTETIHRRPAAAEPEESPKPAPQQDDSELTVRTEYGDKPFSIDEPSDATGGKSDSAPQQVSSHGRTEQLTRPIGTMTPHGVTEQPSGTPQWPSTFGTPSKAAPTPWQAPNGQSAQSNSPWQAPSAPAAQPDSPRPTSGTPTAQPDSPWQAPGTAAAQSDSPWQTPGGTAPPASSPQASAGWGQHQAGTSWQSGGVTQYPSGADPLYGNASQVGNAPQFGNPQQFPAAGRFGSTPPGGQPPGNRGKLLLGVGIGLLVVIALVVAVTLALSSGSPDSDAKSTGTTESLVSALTTSPGAPTKSPTAKPSPSAAAGNMAPVVPGFQVVDAPDVGAAYDVPSGWAISAQGALGGPPDGIIGKGYAVDGKGYCPGSSRTISLLTGSDDKDSVRVATDFGAKSARAAYADPSGGKAGAPQPLASLDGLQHGTFVETRGSVSQPKPGCARQYSIYTFAMPSEEEDGNFVMVIAADTGVPNAIDAETAKRIFTSIRPHKT
ncbi:hypothetical protein [Nocardia arthritidis]|uniref:DUF8017 domain-containing protein n=1 Tax=Nocardia arthritidis TaxID=228602 RepID=A0A6G9Y5E1_9NOCA|nr:hypothetical protein [Nocardia arthritidis]QIS08293.1 hypothetical protein F5544_01860 [Nocardia arthritidis]